MVITVGELRKAFRETVAKDLAEYGFRFDARTEWAKKKNNPNGHTRMYLHCLDYKPSRIEFRLLFEFFLPELHAEMKKFFQFRGMELHGKICFMLGEADFHPKTRDLPPKIRGNASHIVTDRETLKEGLSDCKNVVVNEILPSLFHFANLSSFQEFILNNKEDIGRLPILVPSLLASKLKGFKELKDLIGFLWEKWDLTNQDNDHNEKTILWEVLKYAEIGL